MEPLGAASIFLAICLSCLFFLAAWRRTWGKEKMPPGPSPLPILGNTLQLKTNNLAQTLQELGEKYGPVFTLHFGAERVVVLHGYEAIKEALIDRGEEFVARGRLPLADKINQGLGIIFSNGERWKQLRRFTLTTLRNFGMGKKSIEERIQEEARYLLEKFQDTKGRPFEPTFLLSPAFSNIICSIVFGTRYEYDNKKFMTLMNYFNDNFQVFSSPWGQEKHNGGSSEFTIDNFVMCAADLFAAGTETTSSTLRYGFLILLKYPAIQGKVQEEIDRVVGRARHPCMADRGQMPYTDAVIHEIQRFISLIPLSLPHAVLRDTPFRQYIIPKGTTIFPNLSSVLYDCREFPNPKEFDPRHFLHEDGRFRKSDFFMPFSAGKRICAGEGLARMELFLFFTTILQNFTLKPLVHPKDIDLTPQFSSTGNMPRSYQLCAVPR
ncbi:cytochrome P450 2C19-like isoform X3 [Tiliqua scincoides]|uniref:cytochrome P450 2C19-like isoform X3 n=1 Tax=Tiliqua scincoides TaxID=71010 RepID=UPI0034621B45